MKNIVKIIAFVLTLALGMLLLTACSDPVARELESFTSQDVNRANENIKKAKELFLSLETEPDINKSISNCSKAVEIFDGIYKDISAVQTKSSEVTELKELFLQAVEKYQEGSRLILQAVKDADAELLEQGNESIKEGTEFMDEYNAQVQRLAEEYDMKLF